MADGPIGTPIDVEYTLSDKSVKRLIRPIFGPCDVSVLRGVVVDVVNVLVEVSYVSDQVFPESALPDATLALAGAAGGSVFVRVDAPAEISLD